jgi:hypothetical protein
MAESERWFLGGDRVRCIRVDDPLRGQEGAVTGATPLVVAYDGAGTRAEDPRDVELVRAARERELMEAEEIAERCALQVAPLFRLFGWPYGVGEAARVPTHDELTRTVLDLLRHTGPTGADKLGTATGRFVVRRVRDRDDGAEYGMVALELWEGRWPV